MHHSQGAIADVLVASCALPGLFAPVRLLDGHRHVDAGVLCGVPLRPALDAAGPADRIFVLDCALAPVTSRAGCAAGADAGASGGSLCSLGTVDATRDYLAPAESFPGVLQAVLDAFAVARAGANVAEVGEGVTDPRVHVVPHIADAWSAGYLHRLPASPRDCSAVDELLESGRSVTAAWLDGLDGLDGLGGLGASDGPDVEHVELPGIAANRSLGALGRTTGQHLR